MGRLSAYGPVLLTQPSDEMNLGPAHVRDMARVHAHEAVTAPGSLAATRRPVAIEVMSCGGTGGYST
jgi:hypothetical protein